MVKDHLFKKRIKCPRISVCRPTECNTRHRRRTSALYRESSAGIARPICRVDKETVQRLSQDKRNKLNNNSAIRGKFFHVSFYYHTMLLVAKRIKNKKYDYFIRKNLLNLLRSCGQHYCSLKAQLRKRRKTRVKKNWLSVFAALLLLSVLAAPGMAWQGRMAGAGDAYGLIEDESDYLTHPAVIAMGKGFNAYGHYRLAYNNTAKWDYSGNILDYDYHPFEADGYEWKNEGLIGTAFQVGAGRMGVFFEYMGIMGKYKGEENELYEGSDLYLYTFKMKDGLDNYSLRLIYGLPVGAVNLGAEIQLAYRNEKKRNINAGF